MQPELSELRSFLNNEFEKRKVFNSQYSKRAFSRDLGLGLTSLNDFLAGKRDISLKNVDKIFKYLKNELLFVVLGAANQNRKLNF